MTEAETAVDTVGQPMWQHKDTTDPASVVSFATGKGGPPSPRPSPPGEGDESRFRREIKLRVKTLRSLRAPTVEQIESALFWEEYLKLTPPEGRPLQEPAVEPVQRR